MSGVIVERRDHVLITGGRCPPARAFSTAFTTPLSMNGPFLTERAMFLHFGLRIANFLNSVIQIRISQFAFRNLFRSSILQNHLLSSLVAARLVAASRLTPGRYRISSTGSLALA